MRTERTWRISYKLQAKINGIYREAEQRHLSHEQVMEREYARIHENEDYRKLPDWAKQRLSGYMAARLNALTDHCLEWRVRLDGELVTSDQVPEGRWPDVKPGAHCYTGTTDVFSSLTVDEDEDEDEDGNPS